MIHSDGTRDKNVEIYVHMYTLCVHMYVHHIITMYTDRYERQDDLEVEDYLGMHLDTDNPPLP